LADGRESRHAATGLRGLSRRTGDSEYQVADAFIGRPCRPDAVLYRCTGGHRPGLFRRRRRARRALPRPPTQHRAVGPIIPMVSSHLTLIRTFGILKLMSLM